MEQPAGVRGPHVGGRRAGKGFLAQIPEGNGRTLTCGDFVRVSGKKLKRGRNVGGVNVGDVE